MPRTKSEIKEVKHEPPVMKSDCLTWNRQDQHWGEALVTLPERMLFIDVQETPSIWQNIQQNPATKLHARTDETDGTGTRRTHYNDRCTIYSHDGSWMIASAVVVDADDCQVKFDHKTLRKIPLPAKPVAEPVSAGAEAVPMTRIL